MTKLSVPIVLPPRALRSTTNAGIKAVARIKVLVVIDECRLCIVQVANVVLGRIFRATCIQQLPHPMLQFERVVAFANNVVLMEDVTEKVSVIQLVENRTGQVVGQGFEPIAVIPPKCHVERDDVLDLADRTIADWGAGRDEAVQEGLFAFVMSALKEVALGRGKDGFQK